jgi:hypothetical protein
MKTSKAAHNIGLAIWRLKCFYDTFVQGSAAVILLNFCAKNPPHRQAENRCTQCSTAWSIAYNARRIASAVAHSAGASLHSALRTAYNCGFTRFLSPEAQNGFGLKNLVNPPSVSGYRNGKIAQNKSKNHDSIYRILNDSNNRSHYWLLTTKKRRRQSNNFKKIWYRSFNWFLCFMGFKCVNL